MLQNIQDNLIVHIETLGCRLNQIESESVAGFFSDAGFSVEMKGITSREKENPFVICAVVNTCTVTAKAEQKARRIIRLLLKKFPNAVLIVTGCYAQVNREEICSIDDRIAVLPGRVKSRLEKVPEIIKGISRENEIKNIQHKVKEILLSGICSGAVPDKSENPFNLSTDTFLNHSRASIKIQDGCNNRCTYCEICIARGTSVSLSVDEVVERVNRLKEKGYNEIVITTVNIAQYRGLYNGKYVDFADLLKVLLEKTCGVAFRFSSLYPQIVDDRLCRLIKDERIRPHFHLSVQSGSDKVLERMNRPYKAQTVIDACRRLKEAKENPFLACDIIAGFPGETDDDFNKTMELLKSSGFTWVHAFPFSPRPNTVAFSLKPKVPEAVAGERVKALLDFSVEQKIAYINSISGTKRKAIVETSHGESGFINCVTDNFIHCRIKLNGTNPKPQSEVTVKITEPLPELIKKSEELEALAEIVL